MLPFSIYHINQLNWLNWPCWLFTPTLSDYWAELHWIAIPSQRAMSQLLSFSLPGDYTIELLMQLHQAQQPLKHSFSCSAAFFVFSCSFLPSLSPFSISIKGHPSAKYGSTFSCYPNSIVSAPESTDGCCWWRWWRRGYRHCTYLSPLK